MSKHQKRGLVIARRILFVFGNLLIAVFALLGTLISATIFWMFRTWPNLTMQELMFQLQSPVEGTSKDMIMGYIWSCIPVTVIVVAVVTVLLVLFRKKKAYYVLVPCVLLLSVAAAAGSLYMAWVRLDISSYNENSGTESTFIEDNYADPAETVLTFPEQKRNLIYIFLESVETTYADKESGGAFEENYIPELTELAMTYEDFSGDSDKISDGEVLNYATWTAAALFAQTSGLPLTLPIDGNSMDTQDSFLPDMTALGDILEQQGYNQTFLIGSDGNFGGRSLYFTEHGNYNIKDYYYYQQLGKFPEDYYVWWGYEDEKLFEYAKEELTELSSQAEPFNLTMLTVDTHFEDGYVCELCGNEHGADQYANVMACSSRQVYEFVRWIQQQDFYDNTTIVLSGDHLTMDSDFCEDVDEDYQRGIYTVYINAPVEPEDPDWQRQRCTFDNFPTTLASLGVEIEGERLGLGTNLLSSEQTILERFGTEYVNDELLKKSAFMDELTKDIDEDNAELQIREGRAPSATAVALPYDYRTGKLQVVINNFQNTEEGIAGITAAVWTADDQSDLRWVQAEAQPDGSYLANVSVPNFGFKTGEYYVDVYLTDGVGNQFLICNTTGYVE